MENCSGKKPSSESPALGQVAQQIASGPGGSGPPSRRSVGSVGGGSVVQNGKRSPTSGSVIEPVNTPGIQPGNRLGPGNPLGIQAGNRSGGGTDNPHGPGSRNGDTLGVPLVPSGNRHGSQNGDTLGTPSGKGRLPSGNGNTHGNPSGKISGGGSNNSPGILPGIQSENMPGDGSVIQPSEGVNRPDPGADGPEHNSPSRLPNSGHVISLPTLTIHPETSSITSATTSPRPSKTNFNISQTSSQSGTSQDVQIGPQDTTTLNSSSVTLPVPLPSLNSTTAATARHGVKHSPIIITVCIAVPVLALLAGLLWFRKVRKWWPFKHSVCQDAAIQPYRAEDVYRMAAPAMKNQEFNKGSGQDGSRGESEGNLEGRFSQAADQPRSNSEAPGPRELHLENEYAALILEMENMRGRLLTVAQATRRAGQYGELPPDYSSQAEEPE